MIVSVALVRYSRASGTFSRLDGRAMDPPINPYQVEIVESGELVWSFRRFDRRVGAWGETLWSAVPPLDVPALRPAIGRSSGLYDLDAAASDVLGLLMMRAASRDWTIAKLLEHPGHDDRHVYTGSVRLVADQARYFFAANGMEHRTIPASMPATRDAIARWDASQAGLSKARDVERDADNELRAMREDMPKRPTAKQRAALAAAVKEHAAATEAVRAVELARAEIDLAIGAAVLADLGVPVPPLETSRGNPCACSSGSSKRKNPAKPRAKTPEAPRVPVGSRWSLNGEVFEVVGEPIPGNELRAIRWIASGRDDVIGQNWFRPGGAEFVGNVGIGAAAEVVLAAVPVDQGYGLSYKVTVYAIAGSLEEARSVLGWLARPGSIVDESWIELARTRVAQAIATWNVGGLVAVEHLADHAHGFMLPGGARVDRAAFFRSLNKRPKEIKPARWRELTQRDNPPRRGRAAPAKTIVYVTGHNGDPSKLDEAGAGGFLSIQAAGDHRIDKGTAQRRPALALAKTWMAEHPPLSAAALLEVVEQAPTGAREELGRWVGAPKKRGGGLEWVAQAKPRRAPPVKRAPVGQPWKKEPQFLFAAPEHRQRAELTAAQFGVSADAVPLAAPPVPVVVAPPPPPRREWAYDKRGQGVLLNPKRKPKAARAARAVRENKGVTSRVRPADGGAVVAPSLAKAAGRLAIGRWHVLRRGGEWNANIREAVRGRNFVYAIRQAGTSTVLYVGEAHSAKWKRPKLVWEEIETVDVDDRGRPLPVCAEPASSPERKRRAKVAQPVELRGWKTLLHHFQDPEGKFRDVNEWTWHRSGDLEIALWFLPDGRDYCDAKGRALDLEYDKTLRLRPLHTSIAFQRSTATPF